MDSPGITSESNVRIRKAQNGYVVNQSTDKRTLSSDGNNYLNDYINEEFVFVTLDEALADRVHKVL